MKGVCPFALDLTQQGIPHGTGSAWRVGFCDHTAAGYYSTLIDPDFWIRGGISVHFAISLTGEVAQLVNIFDRAWAQGADADGGSVGWGSPGVTWPPFPAMHYGNPNEYLISTEHEDAVNIDGTTCWTGGVWTPEMYKADIAVKRWCVEELARAGYDVMCFDLDSLAGHYMFDPVNRASCPGTYWSHDYRYRLWHDLSEQTTRRKDMAIIALPNGSFYLVYGEGKVQWIPDAQLYTELQRMVYADDAAAVSQRTWDWLMSIGWVRMQDQWPGETKGAA